MSRSLLARPLVTMTFFKWRMFNFFNVAKDADEGAITKSLEVSKRQVVQLQTPVPTNLVCSPLFSPTLPPARHLVMDTCSLGTTRAGCTW